jgi:hypothetical protein
MKYEHQAPFMGLLDERLKPFTARSPVNKAFIEHQSFLETRRKRRAY